MYIRVQGTPNWVHNDWLRNMCPKRWLARAPFLLRGTPSPPTKSSDFRGFGSSRLLILRGGNSYVR